ncbi:hypothetical protein AAHA92_21663 [Salvia divinorum]|uniref:Uncharacterized protein n=1 Tax=Salvia divinorum TaxID=28513 RepID=A0ABD1GL63_SALDI
MCTLSPTPKFEAGHDVGFTAASAPPRRLYCGVATDSRFRAVSVRAGLCGPPPLPSSRPLRHHRRSSFGVLTSTAPIAAVGLQTSLSALHRDVHACMSYGCMNYEMKKGKAAVGRGGARVVLLFWARGSSPFLLECCWERIVRLRSVWKCRGLLLFNEALSLPLKRILKWPTRWLTRLISRAEWAGSRGCWAEYQFVCDLGFLMRFPVTRNVSVY